MVHSVVAGGRLPSRLSPPLAILMPPWLCAMHLPRLRLMQHPCLWSSSVVMGMERAPCPRHELPLAPAVLDLPDHLSTSLAFILAPGVVTLGVTEARKLG